jgi:tetratricopeptide (TPR) repeat protein
VGIKSGRIFLGLIFLLMAACPALAQEVGKIMSIIGTAEMLRKEQWQSISLHEALQPGDVVRTGPGSRVAVLLADGSQLKINANSHLELKQVAPPVRKVGMEVLQTLLRLFSGEVWVRSYAEPFEIETKAITATIRGTELNLAIEPAEATRLTVVEGVVEFRNPQGSVLVAAKEQAIAKPGEAPRKVVIINPRDAVQWALYYPPLIDYRQVIYPEGPDAQIIRRALEHYRRGALPETLRSLEQVPPERRDARYFSLRAGLLLSVSQVAEARADIAEALRRNPSEATAHALRSIIASVQNQKKEALRLARQAVELEPQSPVPQVALSYAYQATFDLEKALKSLEQAAKLAPEDALIQARLAELELSRGELERALKAARRAVALDPELARTQTVLGFAYLTQIRIAQAKSAFERAITLDSADPLPRLGLGLAKTRESHLTEGAREIEIAASLDPNNALIRSYLGKAYYEEKREGLAARELAAAKELDPKDPTPWFYDAIFKQTINRPVEALRDLQKSIELNNNRVVYRSKLLLDQDLAARSASLGRIYRDLGFEQRALVEGWKSVNTDPADYSGHRFLADSYSALPRHEVARVSELLQSQLLQPINVTPIQPSLAESNLLILDALGPQASAFNEFNPLMLRDHFALQTSGVLGDNSTYGDEVVHSGLWKHLSYSLGQFHYQTDGFRRNNDLTQDIYNAFLQTQVSPHLNVQVEARHREAEHGDLDFDFDLRNFDDFIRFRTEVDTLRAGAHYAFTPHLDVIGSIIYLNEREKISGDKAKSKGYLTELQGIFRVPFFKLVSGGGYYQSTADFGSGDLRRTHENGYFYAYTRYPTNIIWTVGASFDSLHDDLNGNYHYISPKFGFIWNPTLNTTLRAAYFRTLKRSLLADQTIEPTQMAGFNQFFDEYDGTRSRRWGVALDQRIGFNIFVGMEYSERELSRPFNEDPFSTVPFSKVIFIPLEEDLFRAYLHWAPTSQVAISAEYQRELFEFNRRVETITHLAPMELRYFHPLGFISQLEAVYVNQSFRNTLNDDFVLVNLGVGYRLPKRYGIVRFIVRNLFDQDFNFKGIDDQRTPQLAQTQPFSPERSFMAQITLVF